MAPQNVGDGQQVPRYEHQNESKLHLEDVDFHFVIIDQFDQKVYAVSDE